ncbi:MAG: GatB/YqeY domain-containing protein [candidate division Zixibacteria bacterium]|nr:GatB/YqeY domain-containing protein [candidate division Zixibacteria bacterium]
MSIFEQVDKEMIKALKGGDKDRLTVLRGLKSDLKYKKIEVGAELTDEQALETLASAAKKRRESIEQFRAGGREDLVKNEEFELEVISSYLPKQLTEEELRQMAETAIKEVGADSPKQMGLVMKALMPKIKGRADGKLVNRLISELLAK